MGQRADYDDPHYKTKSYTGELKAVLGTEFSEQFVDGMRNRMIVSRYKYGLLSENVPEHTNVLKSLQERMTKYQETGNAEWLIDVANCAMIEYMHPSLGGAHFRATDSHESPGVPRKDGSVAHGRVRPVDLAVERLKARYARSGD